MPIIAPLAAERAKSGIGAGEAGAFVTLPARAQAGSALRGRQLAGQPGKAVQAFGALVVVAHGQGQHGREHRHDDRGGELEAG